MKNNIIWQQQFRSHAEVTASGGTVYGSPSFGYKGASFNGTDQYVSFSVANTTFSSSIMSFVIELSGSQLEPTNDSCIIESNGTDTISVILTSSGNLEIASYGTTITVAKASLENYWNNDTRNVLVITTVDGSQVIYLNGMQVGTDSNSFVYDIGQTEVFVGANKNDAQFFNGSVLSVFFTSQELTAEDAKQLYNRSVYKDEWECFYNFDAVTGTGEVSDKYKILGKSGSGKDIVMGDGTTTGVPSFKAPGISLDGVDDYLNIDSATGVLGDSQQTFCFVFAPSFTLDVGVEKYIMDTTGGNYSFVIDGSGNLVVTLGGTVVASVTKATMKPCWNVNGKNVLVVSGEDGNTWLWLNGSLLLESDSTSWTATDVSDIYVGAKNDLSSHFDGSFYAFGVMSKMVGVLWVGSFTNRTI